MHTIVLRLDPAELMNPDLDLRYQLPDLLAERSGGLIQDNGYDYVDGSRLLLLFLKVTELGSSLACIREVIEHFRVLDNDLRQGVVVAIAGEDGYEVVYPPGFVGPFLPQQGTA
jgi:hypothetical protein